MGDKNTPSLKIWACFFGYTVITAVVVQFVLLPYILPDIHSGHGLLIGGDWISHHKHATALAQRIKTHGWKEWQLRENNQAPAGIAGAVYALTVPEPWTLIPIHAGLHALAALVLLKILQGFMPNWRMAIWGVLPFLLYPTALLWTTQILKDGYSIAGSILFIYGWLLFPQIKTWKNHWPKILQAVALIYGGIVLAWVVRPYFIQLFQVTGGLIALVLSGGLIKQISLKNLTIPNALATFVLIWSIVMTTNSSSLLFLENQVPNQTSISDPTIPNIHSTEWKFSYWLPFIIENRLSRLGQMREKFIHGYPMALSNVDTDVIFHSAKDMLAYLPRGIQLAFLAPFPSHWFEKGSLKSTTIMRRVSAFEMIGVYLVLSFLLYAVWYWRQKIETWILVLFAGIPLIILGMTIPNIGAMYRMRYGFLMILLAFGILGAIAAWRNFPHRWYR